MFNWGMVKGALFTIGVLALLNRVSAVRSIIAP